MGFGGISIWQLLIILAIVVLIFGGKKLRSLGSDLGGAIKGFKKSMHEGESDSAGSDSGRPELGGGQDDKTDDQADPGGRDADFSEDLWGSDRTDAERQKDPQKDPSDDR